jgi:hypothetical protein
MNIHEMAKEMGVKTSDVRSLLNMVSASIEQDGMEETFLEMTEEERAEVTAAYVSAEVKKFSEFCMTLLTNTEKRSVFGQYLIRTME